MHGNLVLSNKGWNLFDFFSFFKRRLKGKAYNRTLSIKRGLNKIYKSKIRKTFCTIPTGTAGFKKNRGRLA